jgi:LacI family transcriptional regulator
MASARRRGRRVEDVVVQLGYRPNVSARSLSSRRSYLIGVIFMRVGAYHYVGEVQVGAMAACRRAGYHLVVEQLDSPDGCGAEALASAYCAPDVSTVSS